MTHVSLPVCSACRAALRSSRAWRNTPRALAPKTASIQHTNRQYSTKSTTANARTPTSFQQSLKDLRTSQRTPIDLATKPKSTLRNIDQKELNAIYSRAQELSVSVLAPKDTPEVSEQRTIFVLEQYLDIARSLVGSTPTITPSSTPAPKGSATSALLGSVNTRPAISIKPSAIIDHLLQSSEQIIKDPKVFINAAILKAYVDLHNLLQRPGTFADVFELYANKPSPKLNSDGTTTLIPAKINHISSAIPRETANIALQSAIDAHDLVLALDIIETSFAQKAYQRAKVVRECAIPGAGLALAPAIAYGASAQFGAFQTLLDPAQATGIAFAGIMTYCFAVGGMGYIALTTANDQMDRVTWALGTPLSERWIREDERAALDKVAQQWGFKQLSKRGDETGEEWESLREVCGVKGMILDRVQLMEGME